MRNGDLWDIINSQINLKRLVAGYFRPSLKVITGQSVDPKVVLDGREVLQFTSLDYLSLANDPRVIDAAVRALMIYGVGSLASPLVTGTLDIHIELQRTLSRFMNAESAVVFTSGMLTNLGSIPAIINSQFRFVINKPERVKRCVFLDKLCHESIRMACDLVRVHGVQVYKYNHLDVDHLNHLMKLHAGELNVIITDAVFSMEGDVAPLPEIVNVANAHRSRGCRVIVYVDDAHGVGVLGANGRGVCEVFNVEEQVIRMGVVSKAFGTLGGFVVGDEWFIDYLCYCTTQMFSMSVPAAETAAAITAIEIAKKEPWRRERVLSSAEYLRDQLGSLGFEVLGNTHIISVVIGDEDESTRVSAELEQMGVLCPEIKSPAVPMGRARLRLSPTYNHTQEDLDRFIDSLSKVASKKKVLAA